MIQVFGHKAPDTDSTGSPLIWAWYLSDVRKTPAKAVLQGQDAVLPVSTVLEGYQGIDGVALSVPCVVGFGGVRRVLEVPMDEAETKKLPASAQTLRESLSSLGY